MQVKKLEYYIGQFKRFLERDKNFAEIYRWESLFCFRENWDIDAQDFAAMYDRSLQSTRSRRLWKRESWTPKEIMLKFCAMQPEFVRSMFKNLFDEEKPVESRISKFRFCCDDLLEEYRERNKRSIENNHYHDDFQMVMLYLAFRFPEKYTLYDYPAFSKTMNLLGIPDIPNPYDIERFIKLTKILNTFLQKDKALLDLQKNRLLKNNLPPETNALLVYDFYASVEFPEK